MRSRQLLFLSVLFLGLLFAEALTTDDKINSIIAKHAAQWRTKIGHQSQPEVQHSITEHNCIHDTIVNPLIEKSKLKLRSFAEEKNLVPHQKEKKVNKRTDYENMEFYIYDQKISNGTKDPNRACYTTGSTVCIVGWDNNLNLQCTNYVCQSDDLLTDTLQTFFRVAVLPALTEIFTEVIQAPASDSNLILNADTWEGLGGVCYPSDVAIPQSFTTTGVPNADFAVFVTARPCDSAGTVAYAAACNYEVTDFDNFRIDRPLAGIINFCPRQFQQFLDGSYTEFEFQGAVKVAVHELTHALGFSSWMYDSFVDENGDYYSNPVNEFTRTGTSPAGDQFSEDIVELQTPNLVSFAKDHYGCSNIKGIELENYGGAGTAGSHWELRVAGDEYMCGYINPSMPVSGLTLSLFDDMGWYQTNKEKADYWAWGKDQGCGFLNDRCEDSWPDAAEGYWCDTDSTAYKCTPDHKAKGQCRIGTSSSNLPPYYQHFTNRRLGGPNVPADCCPFVAPSFAGSNYCIDTTHTGSSAFFEEYSESSACFHVVQGTVETPICYSYECASSTKLTITIDGETFDCPTNGGEVSVNSVLSGAKVECPPASLFCREAAGTSSERLSGSVLIIFVGVMFALIF